MLDPFQDDGDGAIKSGSELITEMVGKLRCAIHSNRSRIFIGSNGRYVNGTSATPDVYVQLYLPEKKPSGEKYARYDYYDINLNYYKSEYKDNKYKYDFGNGLYILVSKDDGEKLDRYLGNGDFTTEYNRVSHLIFENKESEALDLLYDYSFCIYEQLRADERKDLLVALGNKLTLDENYEEIVLNLLRATYTAGDKQDALLAMKAIFKDKVVRTIFGQPTNDRPRTLFEILSLKMNDFNGKANYSEWIEELTKLFAIAYKDELESGKYPDTQTTLPSGITFTNETPYYFKNWDFEGGNSVSLVQGKYSLILANGVKDVNPHDIINVAFNRDFDFIPEGTRPLLAMPAFALVYLLNHEQKALEVKVANIIISAVSIYGAGRNLILTRGTSFLEYLKLLKEVAGPIFNDEEFQRWAIDEMEVPASFFTYWGYIQILDLAKDNLNPIVGLVVKNDWFDSFYTTWKTIIANEELNLKLSKETIDDLVQSIENLKNKLDEENIVY
jgi:hypothetical protein